MAKDIELGLELGKKFECTDLPMLEHIAATYAACIDKYGPESGSAIPCKYVEDKNAVTLNEGENSAAEAFEGWTYTTRITNGSYQVVQLNTENPYDKEHCPFSDDADAQS